MAEGLRMITRLANAEDVRSETVGRPVCPDDEVKFVDDGWEVRRGELSQMIVRGPYTLRDSFDLPEINGLPLTGGGFYRSGDVMQLRSSGDYMSQMVSVAPIPIPANQTTNTAICCDCERWKSVAIEGITLPMICTSNASSAEPSPSPPAILRGLMLSPRPIPFKRQ